MLHAFVLARQVIANGEALTAVTDSLAGIKQDLSLINGRLKDLTALSATATGIFLWDEDTDGFVSHSELDSLIADGNLMGTALESAMLRELAQSGSLEWSAMLRTAMGPSSDAASAA